MNRVLGLSEIKLLEESLKKDGVIYVLAVGNISEGRFVRAGDFYSDTIEFKELRVAYLEAVDALLASGMIERQTGLRYIVTDKGREAMGELPK